MKRALLWLVALLAALSCAARPSPAQTPEKCIVEGIVLSAGTSQPLAKAHVALVRRKRTSLWSAWTIRVALMPS